jgi:hypothetical protein
MAQFDEIENDLELPVGLPPARAEPVPEPPQPLDYRSPVQRPHYRRISRPAAVLLGIGIGIVVTPPALLLAMLSAGAGHGDYGFALLFYPVPVCLARLTGEFAPTLALGVLQFPVYGAAIGYSAATHRRVFIAVMLIIALIQLLAWVVCSSFSFR